MRAEYTKLAGLRSTRWALVAAVGLTLALTALVASGQGDPLELSLAGTYLGQLAIVALGVLAISSEFATGMIRTTFTATPRRLHVLAAKAAVVGAAALLTGLLASSLSLAVALPQLDRDPTAAQAVRGVAGTAIYLAALALFSLGVGTILRHTAAAVSTILGLLWVPVIVVSMLPPETGLTVAKFCPMLAGLAIQRTVTTADSVPIAPGLGLALFCGYAAAALAAGAYLLHRRDT